MYQRQGRRTGFTIIELLAAVAIIALLVAILWPSLQGVSAAAKKASCANNLHQLSSAYLNHRAEYPGRQVLQVPDNWPNALSDYVQDETAPYVCPEDERTIAGPRDASDNPLNGGFDGFAEIPGYTLRFTLGQWGEIDVPLNNNHPRMTALHWEARPPGSRWRGRYPVKPDFGVILEFYDDGRDPDDSGSNPENQFSWVPIADEQMEMVGWKVDAYRSKMLYHDGTRIGSGSPVIHRTGGTGALMSSYGINGHVYNFRGDEAILLLDYQKIVADVVMPDGTDLWDEMVAPRHLDAVNVAFGDGSVETRLPEDIDPRIPAFQKHLWKPRRDEPLNP